MHCTLGLIIAPSLPSHNKIHNKIYNKIHNKTHNNKTHIKTHNNSCYQLLREIKELGGEDHGTIRAAVLEQMADAHLSRVDDFSVQGEVCYTLIFMNLI